jgi:hypothetical protein
VWRACDGYWEMQDMTYLDKLSSRAQIGSLPSSYMHYTLCSTLRHVNWMRWEKGSGDGYENVMHMARMSLRETRQT